MKNNKLFSSFLGGFFGILLSGYAYYLSGKHNFYLVPVGTFLGSLIGFSWHNLKEIKNKAVALTKRWRFLEPKAVFRYILKFQTFAQKKLQQISFRCVTNFFKHTKKIVLAIFQFPIGICRKINLWIKTHPMNKYLLEEIITLIVIGASLVLFIIKSGILQTSLPETYKISIGILTIASCLSIFLCFVLIIERDLKNFYAAWQFYSRHKLPGVIIRIISMFMITMTLMTALIVVLLTAIILLIGYTFTIFILSFVLIVITAIVTYTLRLINDYREASALAITMIMTAISYLLYRHLFTEELMIWVIAFGTGCVSSVSVWLILILNDGWISKRMEKIYHFLTNEDSDMEKVATYRLSWIGLVLFAPVDLAAKIIWPKIDRSSSVLIETVTINFR